MRHGMFKNYRLGCVTSILKTTRGYRMIVSVAERCISREKLYRSNTPISEAKYIAEYDLSLEVRKLVFTDMIEADEVKVGDWIVFGFYFQSFPSSKGHFTQLSLRALYTIDESQTGRYLTAMEQAMHDFDEYIIQEIFITKP